MNRRSGEEFAKRMSKTISNVLLSSRLKNDEAVVALAEKLGVTPGQIVEAYQNQDNLEQLATLATLRNRLFIPFNVTAIGGAVLTTPLAAHSIRQVFAYAESGNAQDLPILAGSAAVVTGAVTGLASFFSWLSSRGFRKLTESHLKTSNDANPALLAE